jgi:hypothetical protein
MENLYKYINYKQMWEDIMYDYSDNLGPIKDEILRSFIKSPWLELNCKECDMHITADEEQIFFSFKDKYMSIHIWYNKTTDEFTDFEQHGVIK